MAKGRTKARDVEPEVDEVEEASAAREFLLARLAIARGQIRDAADALDEALTLFHVPTDDSTGKKRKECLETVDASLSEAARAVQLAMPALADIDPEEAEPDDEDDDT